MALMVKQKAAALESRSGQGGGIRIGLVQTRSTVGTQDQDPRDDNLSRAIDSIKRLSSNGAQLIAFGEMYLSGYRTDEWLHLWATRVDPPDEHLVSLMNCAKECNTYVLIGAATFGQFIPGDIYNSVLIIGPEGLVGVYRKSHVCAFPYSDGLSTERCFYSPGRELSVYDTALGRIGVHICYDISFPEVARVQTLKGAQILINCSASHAGFEEWWDRLLPARAIENMSWYVICSVVGEQRGDVFFGGSRVVDPSGNVVASAGSNQEAEVIADVDLALSRQLRATSHMFSTRQPDLYGTIVEPTPYP